MFPPAGAPTRAGPSNPLLLAVFFFSPLATSVAPRLTPFFFALVSIALIGAALRREVGWRQLLPRGQALQALAVWLLLAAYVGLNATWSVERIDGFGKAAMLAGLAIMSFAAVAAALGLDKPILVRAGLFFAAGAFLGGLFILIELLTDGAMTRTAMTWVPLLQPSAAKHLTVTHGDVTRMKLAELNSNVSMAMFHLWPGLLALLALKGARRTVATTVFFATLAAAIALSEHASSQMALIGSGLVVLVATRRRPEPVIRALAVVWCAAFVLVIPASFIAYQSGLHLATWLPMSARHRVILWEATAEQTLAHPLLGVGVKSTAALTEREKAAAPPDQPEGFVATTHRPPRPQHFSARDLRARCVGSGSVRHRRRGRGHADLLLAGSVSAICRRHLCRLRFGGRICLGHVANMVHVRRGAVAALPARRVRRQ